MHLIPGTPLYYLIHLNSKEIKENIWPYAMAIFLCIHVITNMRTY